jgi:hypothetical protein
VPTDTAPILAEIAAGLGLPLSQASRRFPSARQDRPVSPSCVWRWIFKGVRLPDGRIVRLEAARLAGRWLTSGPAIERFLAAQTPTVDAPTAPPRSPAQRRKASERAAAELEKLGI